MAAEVLSFFCHSRISSMKCIHILVLAKIHQRIICFVVYIGTRQPGFCSSFLCHFQCHFPASCYVDGCLHVLLDQVLRYWSFLSTPIALTSSWTRTSIYSFICSKFPCMLCDKALPIEKRFSNFDEKYVLGVKAKFLFRIPVLERTLHKGIHAFALFASVPLSAHWVNCIPAQMVCIEYRFDWKCFDHSFRCSASFCIIIEIVEVFCLNASAPTLARSLPTFLLAPFTI